MKCNVCGGDIPEGAPNCPICGAPAPAPAPQGNAYGVIQMLSMAELL